MEFLNAVIYIKYERRQLVSIRKATILCIYSENEKHHLFAEIIIRHIPVNKFHLGLYALIINDIV